MNKFKLTILFCVMAYSCISWAQYHSKEFKLGNHMRSKALGIHKFVERDTTLFIDIRNDIKALYISGHITLYDSINSYLRIVLQDCNDMEYMVYETYSLICDSKETDITNTALETKFLEGVRPKCLKIKVVNSRLRLDEVSFVEGSVDTWKKRLQLEADYKRQASSVVAILNNQLRTKNCTWRAGVTDVSLMTYEEKKQLFGGDVPPLAGLEHYKTGVFVMPDFGDAYSVHEDASNHNRSTNMVKEWDWRNRHGKNWLTPAKNQWLCESCWAFAAIGFLEAYINLYYNRLLNYDLSEQELVSCCTEANGCNGGLSYKGLNYISQNGVVMDTCFRYINPQNRICTDKCSNPLEVISLNNLSYVDRYSTDEIKRHLFKSPLTAKVYGIQHEMVLIGYKYLEAGVTIDLCEDNLTHPSHYVISEGDSLEDQTAWLFKNSWGNSWGDNGFGYLLPRYSFISALSVEAKISSLIYSDNDIDVTDADGDGYYFWGVGDRPASLPSWVPILQDGDDSNENYGPLDYCGHLSIIDVDYASPLEITTYTMWTTPQYFCRNIIVGNGGVLEIKNEIGIHKDCHVEVLEGGKLILNGGSLHNASVIIRDGGEGLLTNNGKISGQSGNTLILENGALCLKWCQDK